MAAQPQRRATSRLEVRLEPQDLLTIRQLADHYGLTLTEYVRRTALGRVRIGVDEVGELRARLERVEERIRRFEQLAGG
jgi:uncharacterized protein (DUF1778 family)